MTASLPAQTELIVPFFKHADASAVGAWASSC